MSFDPKSKPGCILVPPSHGRSLTQTNYSNSSNNISSQVNLYESAVDWQTDLERHSDSQAEPKILASLSNLLRAT